MAPRHSRASQSFLEVFAVPARTYDQLVGYKHLESNL